MASPKKSRPKSPSVEKATASEKPGRVLRLLQGVWRPFPLLMASLLLSAIVFWPQIAPWIPDLHARPEYQLPWSQLQITPPTRWVPENVAAQVRQLSGLPDPLPVLDPHLVGNLATAFARHPWVTEVRSVTANGPGSIRVELGYREPVLMVRTKRGLYPVDRDGVLLPPSDFAAVDIERFPVVDGIRSVPGGPSGTAWGDEAVRGAARLAASLLHTEDRLSAWEKFGMSAIAVLEPLQPAETLEQVHLGVTTAAGSQIVWGRPPGADSLEPTVEQKLLRLAKYLPEYGSPTWSGAAVRIDVRQWDVVTQQQLTREAFGEQH